MTLSFERYSNLIATARDNDYIVRRPSGGLQIVTAEQWAREKWQQQSGQWKAAKQEFLEFLDREWGEGTCQALPHGPQDGKPLEVREVRWMIEYDAARKHHAPAGGQGTPPSKRDSSRQLIDGAGRREWSSGDQRLRGETRLLESFQRAAKVDGYIVPDAFAGGVKSLTSDQWRDRPVRSQTWAGNEARRKLVES